MERLTTQSACRMRTHRWSICSGDARTHARSMLGPMLGRCSGDAIRKDLKDPSTSNQLEVVRSVLIRSTSKYLPPLARRDAFTEGGTDAASLRSAHAHRTPAAVRGGARPPDGRPDHRGRGVARAHQGSPHRARVHLPTAVGPHRGGNDPSRARRTAPASAASGCATTARAEAGPIPVQHPESTHRQRDVDGSRHSGRGTEAQRVAA